MEMTLVVVTLVSLALAMAMGVIAWRLLQEERLRAAARVTALEQGLAESLRTNPVSQASTAGLAFNGLANGIRVESLANDNTDWLAQFPSSGTHAAAHAASGTNGVISASAEMNREHAFVVGPALRRDAEAHEADVEPRITAAPGHAAADLDMRSTVAATAAAEGVTHAELFAQTAEPADDAGLSRRIVAITAVAAVVLCAVLAFWVIGRLVAPRVDAHGGTGATAAATAGPAALELVSLRHLQQDGTLTITGLVRNPYGGAAQERLTAVVFFFDNQGGFLSSTRAPLDFRTLSPGEESPFQLSAPAPPGVARYRVSFRREEGAIVPHVDRRQQEASRS